MKKIAAIMFMALICLTLGAVPAKPGFRTYTQPDGTTIVLQQRGDEWGSWFETKSGEKYRLDSDGYFRQVSQASVRRMVRSMAARRRAASAIRAAESNDLTHGTRKIPVVLVQFSDVKFTIENPRDSFDALLNQEGYNGYQDSGASGSVKDFFHDNSHGEFDPVFEVLEPVTLENTMKYYGGEISDDDGNLIRHDKQAHLALYDACLLLDESVDFSQYDSDGDGKVDMVLFYYAGGSQAEGWSTDCIWPHQWYLQQASEQDVITHSFDGKLLNRYFCTSELKGTPEKNTMCSIGVTCHEFSHSLGLPDFYDTDYEENGLSGGVYIFSTMNDGEYLNDAKTPPFFGAEERIMLGWMSESDVKEITPGEHSLAHVDNNVAYRMNTTAEGEYFLFENRGGGLSWDIRLPKGLVVYHVDKSKSHTVGGYTAYELWANWTKNNMINAYGDHPCYSLVIPGDQTNLYYSYDNVKSWAEFVFPGSSLIDYYTPVDWQGEEGSMMLSGIAIDGNNVVFKASAKEDESPIAAMGYSVIDLQNMTIVPARNMTVESATWTVDGQAYDSSVPLTSGWHLIKAEVVFTDGHREILEAETEVK